MQKRFDPGQVFPAGLFNRMPVDEIVDLIAQL